MEPVVAGLGYLKPSGRRPYQYAYEPPRGVAWENCEFDVRDVRIADARASAEPPSIDAGGFELREARSAVSDFLDEQAVTEEYVRQASEIALGATGGTAPV